MMRRMAGLIVYFAVTSLLVVGASEYAQEFIDDQVSEAWIGCIQSLTPPPRAPGGFVAPCIYTSPAVDPVGKQVLHTALALH